MAHIVFGVDSFFRSMIPTTEISKRISALFNRRLTTAWSQKEVTRYRQLVKDKILQDDDMELIERYYVYQRRKGDKGIHRRDLYTFLNNFSGELDRARAWDVDNRRHLRTRVIDNGYNGEHPATDDDFRAAGELARAEVAKLKELLHR